MEDIIFFLSEPIGIKALIASSMVGIMCGVLGCFIVLRNMSLIGDALSHAVLPGIFVAFLIFGYSTIGFFMGSAIAGLLTAIGISWIQQNVSTKSDAAIGIVFTFMFSIGVMGISWLQHQGGVHLDLQDFLFGNMLGIADMDIILTGIVTLFTIVSVIVFYRYLFITTFQPTIAQTMGISVKALHYYLMLLLSFAVVASMSAVGVILVVALLITPAATALLLSDELKKVIVLAALIGVISSITGFLGAIYLNTTPGPAIIVIATVYYFIAVLFSPSKGIFFNTLRNRKEKLRIANEDIIKQIFKSENKKASAKQLASRIGFNEAFISKRINKLISNDIIIKDQSKAFVLSNKGDKVAQKLIKAHRLWETYQVNQMGLRSDQIHEEAERMEHHFSDQLLRDLDKELGYPRKDPHGSPIPGRKGVSIVNLNIDTKFKIVKEQSSRLIESWLWDTGLTHLDDLNIIDKKENALVIQNANQKFTIPHDIASQLWVIPSN